MAGSILPISAPISSANAFLRPRSLLAAQGRHLPDALPSSLPHSGRRQRATREQYFVTGWTRTAPEIRCPSLAASSQPVANFRVNLMVVVDGSPCAWTAVIRTCTARGCRTPSGARGNCPALPAMPIRAGHSIGIAFEQSVRAPHPRRNGSLHRIEEPCQAQVRLHVPRCGVANLGSRYQRRCRRMFSTTSSTISCCDLRVSEV